VAVCTGKGKTLADTPRSTRSVGYIKCIPRGAAEHSTDAGEEMKDKMDLVYIKGVGK